MTDLSSICPPITTTSFSSPSPTTPPSSHRLRHRQSSRSALPSHTLSSSSSVRRSRRSTAEAPYSTQNAESMSAAALSALTQSTSSAIPSAATPAAQQNTTDVILTRVFQDQTNVLKRDDRELIIEFLNGRLRVNPFDPSTSLHRIILNEAKHKDPLHPTRTTIEQIVFEMNFTSGHWRKLRRKAVVRDAVASERYEEHVSKDECPGAEWWSGRIPAGWDSNGNKVESISAVATVTTKHASLSVASREIYVCGR